MKNRTTSLITIGWLLLILAACQMVDEVEPTSVDFREPVIGELFYHPFTLDMTVDGPACNIKLLTPEREDNDQTGEPACVGPVEINGIGYGASDAGHYAARTYFMFDPASCACDGKIMIQYENSNDRYEFALHGHGKLENTIMTSDEIKLPLRLLRFSGPYGSTSVFIGNLIIPRPQVLAKEQDGVVSVHACIMGRFYPPSYPIETV